MRKAGRPTLPINLELLERLSSIQCTDGEIAAVLDISVDTLDRRKKADPQFAEIIKKGREHGKASLRRWQFKAAEKGNTGMMVWLGKQYLNQIEKQEISQNVTYEERIAKWLKDRDAELDGVKLAHASGSGS